MISFKNILQQVVEGVPKSLAAMIIGKDGIAVESYQAAGPGLDLEMLGAEYVQVMSEVYKLVSIFHLEELRDITIVLHDLKIIIHLISEGYYFIHFLESDSNEALGRYRTRVGSLRLRELL